MRNRKALALGLAAVCSAASLITAPAATAGETTTAASCTHPKWKNKDHHVGYVKSRTKWVPIRSGST